MIEKDLLGGDICMYDDSFNLLTCRAGISGKVSEQVFKLLMASVAPNCIEVHSVTPILNKNNPDQPFFARGNWCGSLASVRWCLVSAPLS